MVFVLPMPAPQQVENCAEFGGGAATRAAPGDSEAVDQVVKVRLQLQMDGVKHLAQPAVGRRDRQVELGHCDGGIGRSSEV